MIGFRTLRVILAAAGSVVITHTALGGFHVMQIEQVIGGVNGDTSMQAIQLRMRGGGQIFMSGSRVIARDAVGANPILIKDMTTDVANGATGDRVLLVSSTLTTSPAITADYVMTNTIPTSYLAAGTLTFEDDFGTVYWRVCWGGAAYTGPTTVQPLVNDADGDVAPAFAGAMPSTTLQSLRFDGPAVDASTNNNADYVISTRGATLTNNAGLSGAVVGPAPTCVGDIVPNGTVNTDDLIVVITSWGACNNCPMTPCPADIVINCTVNTDDLIALIGNWGRCP